MTTGRAARLVALALVASACSDSGSGAPEATPTLPSIGTVAPATGDTSPPRPVMPPSSPGLPADADLALEIIALLDEPISATTTLGGEFWMAERSGRIVVLDPVTGAVGDTVLDISELTIAEGERGLLGITVDADNLYLDYTDPDGDTHIDAWVLGPDGRPGERVELLTQPQPFPNHNGGGITIGPDGLLWVAFGDGGGAGDPFGAGQDPTTLLGSIARIDPTPLAADPYAIPADNPWADGVGGRPEIYLTGVRNPWRFSFDPVGGDLWIADVGQNEFEEIDLLLGVDTDRAGANLGWNAREGLHELAGGGSDDMIDPVFEYSHKGTPGGCSVTGGHVYRGSAIAELEGAYVFGDFCTSRLWALSIQDGQLVFDDLDLEIPGGMLASIEVAPDGELLMLSLSGVVSRLVQSPDESAQAVAPDGRSYPSVPDTAAAVGFRLGDLEALIREADTSSTAFADMAHEQQVLYRLIGRNPDWAPTILRIVPDDLRDAIELGITARVSIGGISSAQPSESMPAWEITEPLPADELLSIYQQAAHDTGIDWTWLAAINMVETGFGRIHGLSTSGAQGPMQFMSATWEEVGTGDVDDPHDAIPAAARYLVRRGGPTNMAKAVRGYNNSAAYVDAVTAYASLFAADPTAFETAHAWEIHYSSAAGDLWLAAGYRYEDRIPLSDYLSDAPWSMPPVSDH